LLAYPYNPPTPESVSFAPYLLSSPSMFSTAHSPGLSDAASLASRLIVSAGFGASRSVAATGTAASDAQRTTGRNPFGMCGTRGRRERERRAGARGEGHFG
jgi:hypothetical protein